MTKTHEQNGNRLKNGEKATQSNLPTVVSAERQLLGAATSNESLQSLLATAGTSPTELMSVLTKALGPSEAEIRFKETIIIREE